MIPYGRQCIEEDDIAAVTAVLQSEYLTQGPAVQVFEKAFAAAVDATHAVAVNSGTAALHASMIALGIGPGDEVIVPPITFTASSNCVLFVGAVPVFADVTPSGHIDPSEVERRITPKTRAVIVVDYAGWPCDYDALTALCEKHGLSLVCDACHALGASYRGRKLGSIGRMNNFSFHPVKHIAAGEGGMVTTDDSALAEHVRTFRTHGITRDEGVFNGFAGDGGGHPALAEDGPWHYEMHELGYNYRMADINAALAHSQLKKLERFVSRRREIAGLYYDKLKHLLPVSLPTSDLSEAGNHATHAYHLFPLHINFDEVGKTRAQCMKELRDKGVGTQVHYIPVCLQPYYRETLGLKPGMYPQAERFYAGELSIPMYPSMTNEDVDHVVQSLIYVLSA